MIKQLFVRTTQWPNWVLGLLVLAGLLLVIHWEGAERSGELLPGELFGVDRDKHIVRVEMRSADGGGLSLHEGAGGAWYVDEGIPANMPAVRMLRSDLQRMRVRRFVPAERRDEILSVLLEEAARVDVFVASHRIRLPGGAALLPFEKRVLSFLCGPDVPGGVGTYMMKVGDEMPLVVHLPGLEAGLAELFEPLAHLWFDPVVLQLHPGEIRKLSLEWRKDQAEGFTMEQCGHGRAFSVSDRHGSEMEASVIDSLRMQGFLFAFSRLAYQRIIPGSAGSPPGDLLSDLPYLEMRVGDMEGDEVLLQFYRRRDPGDGSLQSEIREYDTNRFYLRVDGGDYKLALYHTWQPIMRCLSWFLQPDELPDS